MKSKSMKYTPRQRHHARRWIAALLSGDYPQTKHTLAKIEKNEMRFCCLGVLCAITTPDIGTRVTYDGNIVKFDERDKMPPARVMSLVGIHGEPSDYADMNDRDDRSFQQIARVIADTYGLTQEFPQLRWSRLRLWLWQNITQEFGATRDGGT